MIHVNSETAYLGVIIISDITYRKRDHVIAKYSMLDSFSRCQVHISYCTSLYGSEQRNYNSEEVFVSWKNAMRKLFRLPYGTHSYIVCSIAEAITIKLQFRVTSSCIQ